MYYLIALLALIFTATISACVCVFFLRKFEKLRDEHFDKVVGCLHIEPGEDGEEAMIFLELYKNTGDISGKEFVHLAVETTSYITQK